MRDSSIIDIAEEEDHVQSFNKYSQNVNRNLRFNPMMEEAEEEEDEETVNFSISQSEQQFTSTNFSKFGKRKKQKSKINQQTSVNRSQLNVGNKVKNIRNMNK